MIPLKDENPTRSPAVVTLLIIGICVAVYFGVQPVGRSSFVAPDQRRGDVEDIRFNLENAAIPCELVEGRPLSVEEIEDTFVGNDATACEEVTDTPAGFPGKNVYLAILVSMFLHGGLLHLGGNMLYLWIFGNNIEDKRGKVEFAVFYVLAGIAATAAHVLLQPDSTVPLVGASGAIAGVMGAYLVMFPNAPIRTLLTLGFFILFRDIPAKWLLGFWFVSQFFISPNSGVAWAAHVGGFAFGVVVGLVWKAITPAARSRYYGADWDRPPRYRGYD